MSTKRNNFVGVSERRLQGQVGRFGEDLATNLFNGVNIADDETQIGDVAVFKHGLTFEVKATNSRHSIRILPSQSNRLLEEITDGFLFNKGCYACVMYNGVEPRGKRRGKSKIFSRKLSESNRRKIIADELQEIAMIEIDFLEFWVKNDSTLLKPGVIVSSESKNNRDRAIDLNRTVLHSFFREDSPQRLLLQKKYGLNGWTAQTQQIEFSFIGECQEFRRILPVHFIGSRRTGKIIRGLINSKHNPMQLDLNFNTTQL